MHRILQAFFWSLGNHQSLIRIVFGDVNGHSLVGGPCRALSNERKKCMCVKQLKSYSLFTAQGITVDAVRA